VCTLTYENYHKNSIFNKWNACLACNCKAFHETGINVVNSQKLPSSQFYLSGKNLGMKVEIADVFTHINIDYLEPKDFKVWLFY